MRKEGAAVLELQLLLPAWLGGLIIATVAGPLGSLLVWRRMSYFGDTLAHGALLGVALTLITGLPLPLAILLACLGMAAGLHLLTGRDLGHDTLLTLLAQGALALGLIAAAQAGLRVDLMAFLFGDLLALAPDDLLWLAGGAVGVLATLALSWRSLLSVAVHGELAAVEGLPVRRLDALLMVLLALAVAGTMKAVGILLTTALLVMPAATARRLARSPEQMVLVAGVLGGVAVTGGLIASVLTDAPAGPAIVALAFALFLLSRLMPASE